MDTHRVIINMGTTITTKTNLLSLIRSSLWGAPIDVESFSDWTYSQWESFLNEIKYQGCIGIVSDILFSFSHKHSMPQELKLKYLLYTERVNERYSLLHSTALFLAHNLKLNGIDMFLFKGLGVADMYPKPQMREFGDLDIYLFGKYLQGNRVGASLGGKFLSNSQKHSALFLKKCIIENHTSFLNIEEFKIDRILEPYLQTMALEALERGVCFKDSEIVLPTPEFNAIYLLRHSLIHLGSGNMVLRQLCDWAMFLKNYHDKVEWGRVMKILSMADMERFCKSFTYIAIKYLGLPNSFGKDVLTSDNGSQIEELADTIFEYVVDSRYFMNKASSNDVKGLSVIAFKLQRMTEKKRRYKLVYPNKSFAMLVIKGLFSNIRNPKKLFKL